MWRVRVSTGDVVVRLPRTLGATTSLEREVRVLQALVHHQLGRGIAIPQVAYAGVPAAEFDRSWAVLRWLPGRDAWDGRDELAERDEQLAADLASLARDINTIDDVVAPDRAAGHRGGPIGAVVDRIEVWLDDPVWSAASMLEVSAVRRIAHQSRELGDDPVPRTFLHGDLIPGNLLTTDGRLSAVIDWGGAGYGDPAQDLAPAWAVLGARGRAVFREWLDVDQATWSRARLFGLEQAVGGVLYYVPRGHVLGDVMQRTLNRILVER